MSTKIHPCTSMLSSHLLTKKSASILSQLCLLIVQGLLPLPEPNWLEKARDTWPCWPNNVSLLGFWKYSHTSVLFGFRTCQTLYSSHFDRNKDVLALCTLLAIQQPYLPQNRFSLRAAEEQFSTPGHWSTVLEGIKDEYGGMV